MPQIIVTADRPDEHGRAPVMLRERVNASDFESRHFALQLVERLGWAVGDAHALEREAPAVGDAHALEREARAHPAQHLTPGRV